MHGVDVTELATEDWNIELVGCEGVLDNEEGTGQMLEAMNWGGTVPGAHSENHFHAGGNSVSQRRFPASGSWARSDA